MPDVKLTTEDRLTAIEDMLTEQGEQIEKIRADLNSLLQGVNKFVGMADQMKGHPLFAAFSPPPKR